MYIFYYVTEASHQPVAGQKSSTNMATESDVWSREWKRSIWPNSNLQVQLTTTRFLDVELCA